jgi:hypothetical protein
MAVPWLRRLVVGLLPQRSGFDTGSVHVGFVVDEVALRPSQIPHPSTSVFPSQFLCTGAPLLGKTKQKKLIIFITWLHNKPQGCGESVASAVGPFTRSKNSYRKENNVCSLIISYTLNRFIITVRYAEISM